MAFLFLLLVISGKAKNQSQFSFSKCFSMAYPSIYSPETSAQLHARIDRLTPDSPALWGKMNAAQMLSHCCVPYQQILGENKDAPGFVMKIVMRLFFKKTMTNQVDYKPNLPTAPVFIRNSEHDLMKEQIALKNYIVKIQELGPEKLAAIPSLSLGNINAEEWNNMLYKHIDHHLRQFGV